MLFSAGWIQPIKTSASTVFRNKEKYDVSNLVDRNLGRTSFKDGDCFLTDYEQSYHFVELEMDAAYNITAVAILNTIGQDYGNDPYVLCSFVQCISQRT